jgi:hypothetical protein
VSVANRTVRGIPGLEFADQGRERCGSHATAVLTSTLRLQPTRIAVRHVFAPWITQERYLPNPCHSWHVSDGTKTGSQDQSPITFCHGAFTRQVIGINAAILANGGGNMGIGFAIPINVAKSVFYKSLGRPAQRAPVPRAGHSLTKPASPL